MARLLVATVPLIGHVQPMVLLVRALVDRGHDVVWYAGRKFRASIEATGARYEPPVTAADWDDSDPEQYLPELRGKRGLARVRAQLKAMFIAPMVDQFTDLARLADRDAPDAVISDSAHLGAQLLSEQRDLPWAQLSISALMLPSVDTAPFGPGFPPATSERMRARYRVMRWVVDRILFRSTTRAYHAERARAGVAPSTASYFDVASPFLVLQPTIPEFEYPRSDLPPQVHFIGPLCPPATIPLDTALLPAWWPDLLEAERRGTPIVLVTQGTLATDTRDLIEPTLRALADEPVMVVATGRLRPGFPVPANARVATFIPYQALLPCINAMITNAGYGGVQMALQHGVPLIAAGKSEEKPEIAARIAWAGNGLDLRTQRPSLHALRRAVRRVLGEPQFAARARELAARCARYEAPRTASELIEALVSQRAPIRRAA